MSFKRVRENFKEDKKDSKIIEQNKSIQPIVESSDVAMTIRELNDDTHIDGFSNIDMKTRLANIEISSIIALDSLVAFSFLPKSTGIITRSKKRLSVSLGGMGRDEIVRIANGLSEQKASSSFFEKIGGMFGGNKSQ